MAKKKIRTPGISYFGRKVETQEIRFDKDVFFEKQKSGSASIVTTPATLFNGRQFREVKGRRVVALADSDHTPVPNNTFFSAGILPITPSAPRSIQVPRATDFILEALFEDFAAFDFTIINKAIAGGPEVGIIANLDVTLTGNVVVKADTSGTFRAVRLSSTTVDIFRL